MKLTEAKIGMQVYKARPYSINVYCKHGGDADEVPIGSVGTILRIPENGGVIDSEAVEVDFPDVSWTVHICEIEIYDPYLDTESNNSIVFITEPLSYDEDEEYDEEYDEAPF